MTFAPARRKIRRVAVQAIPTIFGIIAQNFLLLNLMPGDAANAIESSKTAARWPAIWHNLQHRPH